MNYAFAKHVLLILVLLPVPMALAHERDLTAAWQDLPPLITGQEITLILPDATQVRGFALSVRPEFVSIDIHKSSDVRAHALGRSEIPRASVSVIELRQHGADPARRIARTTGGLVLGTLAGALVGALASNGDATGTRAGIYSGLAVGTALGWKLGDAKISRIHVIPAGKEPSGMAP